MPEGIRPLVDLPFPCTSIWDHSNQLSDCTKMHSPLLYRKGFESDVQFPILFTIGGRADEGFRPTDRSGCQLLDRTVS